MKKRTKLTAKQTQALALLSTGQTQDAVADALAIPTSTLALWLKTDLFNEELRIAAERSRQTFESRVFQLANASAGVVGDMIKDTKDKERQLEGVKLAFNAAVRLANRYKELQVEGYVAPTQPLVVFPAGTRFPWQNKVVLPMAPLEIPETIDVEAEEVETHDAGSEETT
jgi:hypothetical protein